VRNQYTYISGILHVSALACSILFFRSSTAFFISFFIFDIVTEINEAVKSIFIPTHECPRARPEMMALAT